MKRALTQKVNIIPACAADDSSVVESTKQIPPEVNRRARTSAAAIGLAISMGASSVLLARQGESAMAAEPIAGSTVPTVSSAATQEMGSPELEAAAAEVLTPKTLEHTVQESQNIRLGKSLSSGSVSTETSLNQPQQTEKAETINGLTHFAPETATNPAPSSENRATAVTTPLINGEEANGLRQSAKQQASTVMPVGTAVTAATNVNELLKAKQAVALNSLKESSNRLRSSLAEWKSEEFVSVTAQEIEPSAPMVVAGQLKPIVEQGHASAGVSQWQPKVAAVEMAVAKPEAIAQPQAPAVEESTLSVVYQVKPGDTVDAIARSYGISPATLVKANSLDNPNRIQISQQLKIPQTSALSVAETNTLPSANLSFPTEPSSPKFEVRNASTASWKPNVAVVPPLTPQSLAENTLPAAAPGNESAVVAAMPLSVLGTDDIPPGYMGGIYDQEMETSSLTGAGTKSLSTKYSGAAAKVETLGSSELVADNAIAQQPDNRNKQNSNPYIERLRAEILYLRHQYKQQQPGTPPNAKPQASNPPAPAYPTPSPQEFRPDRYNQALQAEIQRRAEETPEKIPATTARQLQAATASPPRRQVVATAPTSPEYYQPYSQPGQTVSPELPALENQYQYPQNLQQTFNGYSWPARGVLTSGYGRRWGRMHRGIDIAAATGTPIFASAPGVVVYARWNSGGYGNLVQVMHPDGSITRYAHNSRIYVQEGQVIEQGQHIAAMGSTGRSTGPHCHFEIHPPGQGAVNPMAFLPTK